jgi:histone deacetylase 11
MHCSYNISFFGLEKLHPFDSQKYLHVVKMLERRGVVQRRQFIAANEATLDILRSVHSEDVRFAFNRFAVQRHHTP